MDSRRIKHSKISDAGFSLLELSLLLVLISLLSLCAFNSFEAWHERQDLKNFQTQLSAALQMAQTLSLTRHDDLSLCATETLSCNPEWEGHLILKDDHHLIHDFGALPAGLKIQFSAFSRNDSIIIQHQGLFFNNGRIRLSLHQKTLYWTLSKTGVLSNS